jgi:DNA-binding MarR family transcriptional regulator
LTVDRHKVVRSVDDAGQHLTDFGELVVRLSRLLGRLTNLEPFKSSPFGLVEWVALSLIAHGISKNNRQLARNLGVSRQRANQIKTALEKLHLVEARQSDKDARISLLSLTSKGELELQIVDAALRMELAGALNTRKTALTRANKSLKILTRLLGPQTGDVSSEKQDRAERTLRRRARLSSEPNEPATDSDRPSLGRLVRKVFDPTAANRR